MNETTIARICLAVTIIGIVIFTATYEEEFQNSTVSNLLHKEGEKGIIFGKIDYVIKNYPVTIFIINDGNTANVYYPKATTFENDTFVKIYAQSEMHGKTLELFAQRVIPQ
ncbi:MAG: hypothetical protein WCI04_05865 [archaeon]